MKISNKKAYTMMEVIIVGIILTMFIGFVVPSFDTYTEKAKVREAANILYMIHGAQKIYNVKKGEYLSSSLIATINTELGLSITNTDWNFVTDSAGACSAERVDGPTIGIALDAAGTMSCNEDKYCDQVATVNTP